jgi:outer membrane lipoprotein-sorting protein
MKKLFLLLLSINLGLVAFSQEKPNEAESLLMQVSEKIENYDNMHIEFSHTFANKIADIRQETRGNVTLQGDKYHLNYMGTEQVFDGEELNMIVHEDEEIIIQKETEEESTLLTPSKMFTFYKKGFIYEMDVADKLKGVSIQYVKLMPKDRSSEVLSIKIGVDITSKHIYNVIETGKNGTVTELTVVNFKSNQEISSSLFELDEEKYQQKNYMITRLD